ncbi:MAG: OmpA family protein [Sporomusaceae bacterium]|jgi:chemotaxis protein MotB|nr:OmpA family protein [Sporomusaceae bacterium]
MPRKPKKEFHEEHADETWLVPYSDILTLLLALFIVLFASSQIDQKKLDQMSESFSIAFGGQSFVHDRQSAADPINTMPQISPPNIEMPDFRVVPVAAPVDERAYMRETAELIMAKRQLDAFIAANGLAQYLSTALTDEGLMIRIRETALFPSGSADLNQESRYLVEQLAEMLMPLTQQVTISGHTDNVPINTRTFPSNWELSSSRAVNFTRLTLLLGNTGDTPLLPARFRAIGYGEYRPIEPNDTPEGRAANRRVEVFVLRNYRI